MMTEYDNAARLCMQTGGALYSIAFDFGDKLYHTADKPFVFIYHGEKLKL